MKVEAVVNLSQTDKAKAIQRKLYLNGYRLRADGKFGKRSIFAAKKYLRKRGVIMSSGANLDDYYNAIINENY